MTPADLSARQLRLERAMRRYRQGRLDERRLLHAARRAVSGLETLAYVPALQKLLWVLPEPLRGLDRSQPWELKGSDELPPIMSLALPGGDRWEQRYRQQVLATAAAGLRPPAGWRPPSRATPEATLRASLHDDEPWIRLGAAAALTDSPARYSTTALALAAALGDEEPQVRAWASLALGRMGPAGLAAASAVEARLAAGASERCRLAWTLARIGGDRVAAAAQVRAVVADESASVAARGEAVTLLVILDEASWDLALALFLSDEPALSSAGGAALRALGPAAVPALPALVEDLGGPRSAERLELLRALALPEAAPALTARLRALPPVRRVWEVDPLVGREREVAEAGPLRDEVERLVAALGATGPAAAPSADAVAERLTEGLWGCSEALAAMGVGAAPALVTLLERSPTPEVAQGALEALAGLSGGVPRAEVAAPWLEASELWLRWLAAAVCIRSEDRGLATRAAERFAEDCDRDADFRSPLFHRVARAVAPAAATLMESDAPHERIAGVQALGWTREYGEAWLSRLSELALDGPQLALQVVAEEAWWRLELPSLPFRRRRRSRR